VKERDSCSLLYACLHASLKEHFDDSSTYNEESWLTLYSNKAQNRAFMRSYALSSTPLPPLGEISIRDVPEEDPSLADFLRHCVPQAQLKKFFFWSESPHGQLGGYLEALETLAPSVSEQVLLGQWDITSTDMINRHRVQHTGNEVH